MSKPTYYWMTAEGDDGRDRVLLEHYGDSGVRTRVLEADDLEKAEAWKIATLLNGAYEAGRTHAMEDLRRFIGIK
jgi:hypothetical protein